jgi:hypothetical protein
MTVAPTSAPVPVPGSRGGRRPMRFSVDGWDPSYGSSLEADELGESTATIRTDVERPESGWGPVAPVLATPQPAALRFVDGVRRIEARVWIDEETTDGSPATDATAGLCASYAAGVMCCCHGQAHLLGTEVRRGLFTIAGHAVDVPTRAGAYRAWTTRPDPGVPLPMTLSQALQRQLAQIEGVVAAEARGHACAQADGGTDLLVVDGPLRGRQHLPRSLGFIKTHRTAYLPPALNAIVGTLPPGYRTPVFRMGTSWDRHSWYLRLPCAPAAPWAGVVRIECAADLPVGGVVELANLSQVTLPRFASSEYKDARAPQNLYPIAGLERQLRRRLGDPRVLYRALRRSAVQR